MTRKKDGEVRRKYVRLDAELVESMFQDGVSAIDIAEFFGSNPSSIYGALRRAQGLPSKPYSQSKRAFADETVSPPTSPRRGEDTPGAPNISRSGGFYKGRPKAHVVRLPQGLKSVPQPKAGDKVAEAYSLTRKLEQALDGIWRNGAAPGVKIAAKKCYALATEIEDSMTRAVRESYTDHQGGVRSVG